MILGNWVFLNLVFSVALTIEFVLDAHLLSTCVSRLTIGEIQPHLDYSFF